VSLISTVGGLIGLYFINHNWFARKEMEHKYEILRFRLGKKYKLKEAELPKKPQAGITDLLKGIDREKIQDILEMIQGGGDYEEGEEGGTDLMSLYKDNKELINGFLDGIKKGRGGSGGEKPETKTY